MSDPIEDDPARLVRLAVRLPRDVRDRAAKAAKRMGMGLGVWIRVLVIAELGRLDGERAERQGGG